MFAYKDGFKQKLESKNDLSVYNTRHAWTLFSSVCLFVASSINNTQTGTLGGGDMIGGRLWVGLN